MPDGASVVINGSMALIKGTPAFGVYAATKAALRSSHIFPVQGIVINLKTAKTLGLTIPPRPALAQERES